MRLLYLTEADFLDIVHFTQHHELPNRPVTNWWMEDMLMKAIKEIQSLKERCDNSFQSSKEWWDVVYAARCLLRARKKGEELSTHFQALEKAFKQKRESI